MMLHPIISRFLKTGIVLLLAGTLGCATYSKDPLDFRSDAWEALHAVDNLKQLENSSSEEVVSAYENVLKDQEQFNEPFEKYRGSLQNEFQKLQQSSEAGTLPDETGYGFPEVYALRLLTVVKAHQGLSRVYAAGTRWPEAETHAIEAVHIIAQRAHSPTFSALSQIESYQLLQDIYTKQGKIGKALMAKLNLELLQDHLSSEGGIRDYFDEKAFFYGETTNNQLVAVENLVSDINYYRAQQAQATAMAVGGALMAANASLQQGFADAALAKSGGVMTPQARMAQNNARFAQAQSQIFMTMVKAQAEQGQNPLQMNTTPWALPTFTQQLVDPKQGANTPTIMKGFAANVVQVGGTSYQGGAEQVTQQVDALMPYRQSGQVDGAVAQVEKFAEVFNGFLTQVQEIRK